MVVGENTRNVMRIGLGVVLVLSSMQMMPIGLILDSVEAEGPLPDDDWPMFRHDMNRTGNTSSKSPNTNNVLWTHQALKTRYSWGYTNSPAVVDGMVYLGSRNPNLIRAIDAVTGVQSWAVGNGGQTSSPTVANGHVFFGSYDRGIHSIRQDTGALNWRTPVNDWVDSSPVVHEGKVYVGSGQGDFIPSKPSFFYCLDETNGNVIWTFLADGQIVASPTIVNDQVIFGSYDGNVYAIPTEDPNGDGMIDLSEVIWIYSVGDRIVGSAAVEDGVVYVGSLNGILYALPLNDPNGDGTIGPDEVVWKFTTGNQIWGSPGIARGRIFIGSHDYYAYALPKEDPDGDGVISANEVLWKFRTTDKIWNSPSIAGGKVFVGSEDYTLWALSEETGEFIWNYIMPLQTDPYGSEYLYSSATIVDGRVYIGNFDLTVYCFGMDDDIQPIVTGVSPANDTLDVALNTDIEVTFNEELEDALITDSSLLLQSSSGEYSTGQTVYDSLANRLLFNPEKDLVPNERYTVRLLSRYFQDPAGNPLDGNGNGVLDAEPHDDYVWHFNTSKLIGHKPWLEAGSVTPQQGHLDTSFEFFVTYFDEDGDAPIAPAGYVKIFIDGSPAGAEMVWANNTNIPESYLLDRDYTNGELFRIKTQLGFVGAHRFRFECSDGTNTNQTGEYFGPMVLNAPPEIAVPIQYVNEDEEHNFSVRPYVQDIDNDVVSLTFVEDSEYCEIADGHILSCLFSVENLLSDVVNVTVSDGINIARQGVLFIINPVDDPPSLRPGIPALPPVDVYEDSVYVVDLDEYVTDPDTPKELLQASDDSEHITTVGLNLYLSYPQSVSFEKISLTISDGSSTLQLYLDVDILPVNGNESQTEVTEGENVSFWLLMVLLVVIIVVLVIVNIWMIYRRRQSSESPNGGDEE